MHRIYGRHSAVELEPPFLAGAGAVKKGAAQGRLHLLQLYSSSSSSDPMFKKKKKRKYFNKNVK